MQVVYVGYNNIVPFGAIGEVDGTPDDFTFVYDNVK